FVILLFFMIGHPPISTLFPYTTLFRSVVADRPEVFLRGRLDRDQPAQGVKPDLDGPGVPARAAGGDQGLRQAGDVVAEDLLEPRDRKSTRLNSSHFGISYAVFCLKKTI